jgi:hypothetical protein
VHQARPAALLLAASLGDIALLRQVLAGVTSRVEEAVEEDAGEEKEEENEQQECGQDHTLLPTLLPFQSLYRFILYNILFTHPSLKTDSCRTSFRLHHDRYNGGSKVGRSVWS